MKNEAGKGDRYRPVDHKKWSENYDRIFGKKALQHEISKKACGNRSQTDNKR